MIPGGVNSPVRAFGSVGGEPYFVAVADGAYLTDVDGNRYVDYVQSWGASILGHAHPAVVDAVASAAARGTTYGAPTESEVVLAEKITASCPGCEMVRLVSSGTEAAMTAIRIARGVTGRERVVKFAGCYHGHSDALLASGRQRRRDASGSPTRRAYPPPPWPRRSSCPTTSCPMLDERVACVIVEPVAANMGLVAAGAGVPRRPAPRL